MAAADSDNPPQSKRLRWTNGELSTLESLCRDVPTPGGTLSSEERDARAKKMALVAYDHKAQPDPTSESGDMDDHDSHCLTSDQLDMWQTLLTALQQLAPEFPFCEDNTYPWLEAEDFKAEHTPYIHQVMAILFGTWCRSGGVKRLHGDDTRVRVYLPHGSFTGRTSCERGQVLVLFQSIENKAVYVQSSTTLNQLAVEYVECLRRHHVFNRTSESFFVPALLYIGLAGAIVSVIVGNVNREPAPNGPFSIHLKSGPQRGIQMVPMPNRRMWAVGRYVIAVPIPVDAQYWYSTISKNKEKVPQISVIVPNEDDTPVIPMTRHFKMSPENEAIFIEFLRQICGCVVSYAESVYAIETEDDARQWISDATFKFLHLDGHVKSFMSFLGKVAMMAVGLCFALPISCKGSSLPSWLFYDPVWHLDSKHCRHCRAYELTSRNPKPWSLPGAQYMQTTCIELQEPTLKNVNIAIPRAYYTTDNRYADRATAEERRIVAMFVNVLGMTMFSYRSDISGLVGVPGTNKSTLVDLLQIIAGGPERILYVTEKYDKFTLGSFLMNGRSPLLMVISDSFDGSGGLSPELKDGFIGKIRSAVSIVSSNPKGVNSTTVEVEQIAGVMCRNKPPKSITDRVDLTDVEKWKASVVGCHDGDMRRGFPAPPMTISLHAGTVNPSRCIDNKTVIAYEKERIESSHGCEIPYIMVIMWMVTVLAESVPDKTFGLGGSNNSILMETIKRYVEPQNENIAEILDLILEPSPKIIKKSGLTINGKKAAISIQTAADMSTVMKYLSAKVGQSCAMKPLPSSYIVSKNKLMCAKCNRVFFGVRFQSLIDYFKDVKEAPRTDANCFFKTPCPKHDSPCLSHLVRADVLMGYKLRDTSGQSEKAPQVAGIFQKHS